MVLGLCTILSDAMNIILSMRIDLINTSVLLYRLNLFISIKSFTKRFSKAYFIMCTPSDFDSVPSNRVDISIVARASSTYTLRSIYE